MTNATATRWTWMDSPELMARLTRCQNNGRNDHQDIMTFAGFCGSEEALRKHVESYEAAAKEAR